MNQSSNTITCRLCWDGVLHDLLLCNGVATHIKDNPQKHGGSSSKEQKHGGSSSIIGQKTYSNSSIQKNQRRRHATPTPSPQHHRATLSCNTVYCRLCDTHIEDNPTALQHHYNSVQHETSLFDQSKTSSKPSVQEYQRRRHATPPPSPPPQHHRAATIIQSYVRMTATQHQVLSSLYKQNTTSLEQSFLNLLIHRTQEEENYLHQLHQRNAHKPNTIGQRGTTTIDQHHTTANDRTHSSHRSASMDKCLMAITQSWKTQPILEWPSTPIDPHRWTSAMAITQSWKTQPTIERPSTPLDPCPHTSTCNKCWHCFNGAWHKYWANPTRKPICGICFQEPM